MFFCSKNRISSVPTTANTDNPNEFGASSHHRSELFWTLTGERAAGDERQAKQQLQRDGCTHHLRHVGGSDGDLSQHPEGDRGLIAERVSTCLGLCQYRRPGIQ